MGKQVNGWILNGICFIYGFLRIGDWIEGNTILDIFIVIGFCYSIYLTRKNMK